MGLLSESQRRGLVVMASLLVILLLIYLLADRMQPTILLDEPVPSAVELQPFNPNVDSYETMREKGVPVEVAVGIVRWRNYGKRYRIKEDLALVLGMTDSLYQILKPYICIADSLAPQARVYDHTYSEKSKSYTAPWKTVENKDFITTRFSIDTVSTSYLASWGLSLRQAEVVLRYRDACGGIFSREHLGRCYVVDEEFVERISPYIIFTPAATNKSTSSLKTQSENAELKGRENGLIEINSADSATLVALYGIGPQSAHHILRYRELLGGYHSVEQLRELKWVTEENFNHFSHKIYCDSCNISKIDINFAGPKELERHPYVSARALRRIIKQRQLKGGWIRIEEMIEQNILTDDEAKRLAPYLRFGIRATE